MKIYLGADHAGFKLKEFIKRELRGNFLDVYDEGAFEENSADDYPDFVDIVARQVAADPENARGIVFGGSGQGEAMCANRYKKVRAAVFYGGPPDIVRLSREHNNANILSLGARFISFEEAKRVVAEWLEIKFSGEDRHIRRNTKLDYKLTNEIPEF